MEPKAQQQGNEMATWVDLVCAEMTESSPKCHEEEWMVEKAVDQAADEREKPEIPFWV